MKKLLFLSAPLFALMMLVSCQKEQSEDLSVTHTSIVVNPPNDPTLVGTRGTICTLSVAVTSTVGSTFRVCGITDPLATPICTGTSFTCAYVGTNGRNFPLGKSFTFTTDSDYAFSITNTGGNNVTISINGGPNIALTTTSPTAVFLLSDTCGLTQC
ncbi:MAG: hypothetical protein GC192_17285 [Bacteroidetes bacterium]|nr:hypothetical protein [Bacteroidota bacterium]